MQALDRYKHLRRRRVPNCCEILGVLPSLGYCRVVKAVPPRKYPPNERR